MVDGMRSVLISGAGVAGPALAFFLARHGFQVTVVERAAGQRSSGNPVDVRGPGLPVAAEMGILDELREASTGVTGMRIIGADGRSLGGGTMPGGDGIEVPRADLARILYGAARDSASFVFDDSLVSLDQDADGVDVSFASGSTGRFDLVVGADGLHSNTRRLAFGSGFVRHLGVWVATVPLGSPWEGPREVLLYNTPGRLVSLHPGTSEPMIAFIFRGPDLPDFDHRNIEQHRRVLSDAYRAVTGWRVPALIGTAVAADDLYFDSVSTVVLPSWSRGRVVLLGDAAASVSLFGNGSTMALAGASTLAAALSESSDAATAFRRYEAEHRRRTDPLRRAAGLTASFLVPRSRAGIAVRNKAMVLALPGLGR